MPLTLKLKQPTSIPIEVQGIGWRSTRLITRSLERLEVPNAVLARDVITNYRGNAVGDDLFVGLSYDAPPNRVKEIILRVLHHNPQLAHSPAPQVWVVEYGDFAVKYRIRFWMIDYAEQDLRALRESGLRARFSYGGSQGMPNSQGIALA